MEDKSFFIIFTGSKENAAEDFVYTKSLYKKFSIM